MSDQPGRYHPGAHAVTEPDRPAIIMSDDGSVFTYGALDARSNQLARLFRDAGCITGSHVAMLMGSHPSFAEACWAAHRSGLYYSPINPRLTTAEAAYIVNDCEARVVVTTAAQAELVEAIKPHCPGVRVWLVAGDGLPDGRSAYEASLATYPATPLEDEVEGSVLLYSSGTTGRPKGIMRPMSGRPLGTTIHGLDPATVAGYDGTAADSVSLITMPLFHSGGLTRLMLTTALGSTTVLMPKFDAEGALATIERHRVTHTAWVATMLIRILRLEAETRRRYDISSMRVANIGRAPTPAWVKQAIIEWWGPILTETYGATEGNGMTRISSAELAERPESVGRAMLGRIHILDDERRELPAGEVGLVYFSGGRQFEYYKDPERTAAAYDSRGRSTVGDIGYVDEEGYLYITDREADVIISGGMNIYPREVEDVLLQHPAVEDAAVVGAPNDEYGEEVLAIITLRPGFVAGAEFQDELLAFCRGPLAGYKIPRSVEVRDELPRHENGKLLKRLLRDELRGGAGDRR